EMPLMFFFATLILLQIPGVHRMAGDSLKLGWKTAVAFVAGVAVIVVLMAIGDMGMESRDGVDNWVMVPVGLVQALSMLSPGISGSTVLLVLGLFDSYTEAIGNLDIAMIAPLVVGLVVGVLAFSRMIHWCIVNHREMTYSVILGLTFGSVLAVIYSGWKILDGDWIGCAIGLVLGILAGVGLNALSKKIAPKE
ncbi:MAG: DUF368 domain-containing protein, partial [Candidatus Methanomethylophilaceae archaeon]|nr:DUF368 domain-containing protein [Candidatus Methanomethylophilaceae archaeon]